MRHSNDVPIEGVKDQQRTGSSLLGRDSACTYSDIGGRAIAVYQGEKRPT